MEYYALTCESFDCLLARARGACEICRVPQSEAPGGKLLIDHDHARGRAAVRGLVCPACNGILGRVDAGGTPPAHLAAHIARYLAHPYITDPPYISDLIGSENGDVPSADLRKVLADVLNEAAVRGRITYITSRGRRIAAVVPVPVAEEAEIRAEITAPPPSAS